MLKKTTISNVFTSSPDCNTLLAADMGTLSLAVSHISNYIQYIFKKQLTWFYVAGFALRDIAAIWVLLHTSAGSTTVKLIAKIPTVGAFQPLHTWHSFDSLISVTSTFMQETRLSFYSLFNFLQYSRFSLSNCKFGVLPVLSPCCFLEPEALP